MSQKHEISCWKCHEMTLLETRNEFDGCCWACGEEIDLDDYLIEAMDKRDEHYAALSAVTAERDRLRELSVERILLDVVPGDGDGHEVYAKSVAEVESALTAEAERAEALEAERDQYRDMAGCMDLLRRDLIEAGIVGESCPPMFMTEGVLAHIAKLRAEVEASDWVPLTKAAPPDGVPVLRWPGWAAEFSIDEWCNDYGCFLMSIEGGERATHWKPLCAPKAAMAAKEA